MKNNKINAVIFTALLISIIIQGAMPSTVYFTYHMNLYTESIDTFILSFSNYLSFFLIFASGIYKIYNLKRLLMIFIVIQPVKLFVDFCHIAIYQLTNIDVFIPLLDIFLLFIMIFLADLFITDKSKYKENLKNSKKHILTALIFSAATNSLIYIICILLISILKKIYTNAVSDTIILYLYVFIDIFILIITLVLFVAGILFLANLFGKVYIPSEKDETKCKKYSLLGITVALMIICTVFFLKNNANPILYNINLLKNN